MDMALGRLAKTGDNSVIVIKVDDVDGKKLPKALKERSYIDYYGLNEKETWEKQLMNCLKFSVKHKITQNSFVKSEMEGVYVWQWDESLLDNSSFLIPHPGYPVPGSQIVGMTRT